MRSYNSQQAIARINALAQANQPFLFVIDYKLQHTYIEELNQINKEECLFSFHGQSNVETNHQLPQTPVTWKPVIPNPETYHRSFDIVQQNLLAGNSFLTNLTCKVPVHTNLSLYELFMRSKALYKLWIKDQFICFSPEIFIRIEAGKIKSFPMKGTIDATLPHAKEVLLNDRKEAAEHATIVDLIRNDLSIVATHVQVDSYRYIDTLMTNKGPILQSSSEISGWLPNDYRTHLGEIIYSQLPAGSITGAPKKKTVEIIAEAEGYERGFYTGIMGIYNNGNVDSAVMIRYIEQEKGQLYFKAGGGITAQSQWENEYNEVIQKIYVPIY